MAQTFILKSHSYDGRYLELSCTQTRDTAGNSSKIAWTLSVKGGESGAYTTGPTTVKIGGSTVYYKAKTSYSTGKFPAVKGSVSGSLTVAHQEDGKAKVVVSIKTNIYTGVIKTTEDTWTLDAINRYAILKKAPDFTDEGNLTLSYTAPGDLDSMTAILRLGSQELIRRENTATFHFTQEERTLLCSKTPNASSLSLTAVLRSVRGSASYESTLPVTMTVVPAPPLVSVSVTDINSAVTAITGNDRLLVAGVSQAQVSAHAQGQKGASIHSVKVTQGNQTLGADGVIVPVGSTPIQVTATDSRGLSTTLKAANTIVPYTQPSCRVIPTTPTGEGKVTVMATGKFYAGSLGQTENTLQAEYRYRALTDAEFSAWQSMSVSAVNGEYTAQAALQLPDYRKTYLIRARVTDVLTQTVSEEQRFVATPVFDWSGEDFRFHVPVSFSPDEKSENALCIHENRISHLQDPQDAHDAVSKDYLERMTTPEKIGAGIATKCLWEGSWASGKITVPDTEKYTAFSIGMSGQGTTIIAFKRWTHIRGIGGYSQGNGEMTSYHFTATFEGNTWNFVACNKYKHYASSDHGSNDACTITDIYGLF